MVDFNKLLNAGLNRPGRAASWAVAVGVALYLAKRQQEANTGGSFDQQEEWNKKVLKKTGTKAVEESSADK